MLTTQAENPQDDLLVFWYLNLEQPHPERHVATSTSYHIMGFTFYTKSIKPSFGDQVNSFGFCIVEQKQPR